MSNKQKTAVEWLVEKMLYQDWYTYKSLEYIQQAKQMERQQIIETWNTRAKIDGIITFTDNRTAEQYYKETYEDHN